MDQYVAPEDGGEPDGTTLDDLRGGGLAPHIVEARPLPALYSRGVMAGHVAAGLAQKLRELGAARVGVDDLPFAADQEMLRLVPGYQPVAVALALQVARAVKHPAEIALMSAAAAGLDRVFAVAMAAIAAGETLAECRSRAAHAMCANGAEAMSHLFVDHGSPTELKQRGGAESDRVAPGTTGCVDMGSTASRAMGPTPLERPRQAVRAPR